MKNKQFKIEQQSTQIGSKIHRDFNLVFQLRNWKYCWNASYLIHILSYTQNVWALGFRPLLKQIIFLVSWLCVYMASIMMSWHAVANWRKYYPQIFHAVGSFYGSNIFLLLNLKPDDRFIPYTMPEGFSETGHGHTDIIIAWAEFKPVFFEHKSTRAKLKALYHGWGLCEKSL